LIALINREPGYEVVRERLKKVEAGSVNVSFVSDKLPPPYQSKYQFKDSKIPIYQL
jgi:hypothetical protein